MFQPNNRLLTTIIISTYILLISCRTNTPHNDFGANEVIAELQQQPSDLLVGISKAICYSGYRNGQHPDRGEGAKHPSEDEILEDLHLMLYEGFHLLRLYDSSEKSATVLKLIAEHQLPMKVMLGIWLNAELSNHESCAWLTEPISPVTLAANRRKNAGEIERGVALALQYSEIVVAVNVGNEVLVDWNDHAVQEDTLIGYVRLVKSSIQQPVTVAENYEWWAARGQKLAAELDFIAIHIYPIWEGRGLNDGIIYSIENVQKVRSALPNHKIVISEAGWATTASEFGERASESLQKEYYDWLMFWSRQHNITTFFFEAFDEPWKGDPNDPNGAEKHWGLWFENRHPKKTLL